MPKNISRITRMCLLTACFMTVMVFVTPVTAYAASIIENIVGTVTQIDTTPFWYWYKFIRDILTIPLLIIRFAAYGYSILASMVYGSSGGKQMSDIKKGILESILIILALFLLPGVMKYVKGLVKQVSWSPWKSLPSVSSYWRTRL